MATSKNTQITNSDGMSLAIARFKARRARRMDEAENPPSEGLTPEELVQLVKDRRDRRDAEGDPKTTEAAMGTIAQQDEDLDTLLGVIESLMAASDFAGDCDTGKTDGGDTSEGPAADSEETGGDEGNPEFPSTVTADGEEECNGDEDGPDNLNAGQEDGEDGDDKGTPVPPVSNADSRSAISEHLSVCRIGDKLHLDGLDRMSLLAAKKAVIKKVRPGIRLDGKGKAYINAAYDMAVQEVKARKSTDFQRQQMMGGGKRSRTDSAESGGAISARNRMMDRNINRNGGKK